MIIGIACFIIVVKNQKKGKKESNRENSAVNDVNDLSLNKESTIDDYELKKKDN